MLVRFLARSWALGSLAGLSLGCSSDREAPVEPDPLPRTAALASVDLEDRSVRIPRPGASDDGDRAMVEPVEPVVATPTEGPELLSVAIQHSLEASLSRADAELGPALAQVAKRVLVWWLDVRRDLRAGDELELMFERVPDAEPVLLWVAYRSDKHGRRFEAVRHQPTGSPFARYYDRDGREVEARLQQSPIESYEQVTSLIGDGRGHKGVDFKAPVGTPIVSPFDGTVTRRNWSTRGNGRCLEIADAKTGVRAMFLHLSEIVVRPGDRVRQGQLLARSGNTGRSTAPHLHYQLERENGRIVDPLRFHDTHHRRLPETERAALSAKWAEVDARLRPTEG